MQVSHIKDVGASSLLGKLSWFESNGFTTVIILAAVSEYHKFEATAHRFKDMNIQIAGGFFPYISHQDKLHESGALLIGICKPVEIAVISAAAPKNVTPKLEITPRSALVLMDALSPDSEQHINILNSILDPDLPIIGMGAGSMDFVHRPILLTNEGFLKEGSILIAMERGLSQSTNHGYEVLAGPFLTTKTEGKTTYELNYEAAYDVYLNSITGSKGALDIGEGFYDWAKAYPLGLENYDGSFIIRDAIQSDGASFTCVGSIPQNSIIYVMQSNAETLVASTKAAALKVTQEMNDKGLARPEFILSIGCISRQLFLGDDYYKELRATNTISAKQHAGVLSLGEISNYNASNAALLNKTLVMGIF